MTRRRRSDQRSHDDQVSLAERIAGWRTGGPPVAWDDVIGHAAAKRELRVVTEQIRRHSVAERLGLTMVKGVVIFGPPGSGKTMLAKALAAAVERPVYVIPAAEVDAELVRRVYEQLAAERCVIVWDEADILLRKRDSGHALDDGRIAAAFCSALDGVTPISGPVTVALTAESEWYLDRSALRAGRLTTKITLRPPRRAERLVMWQRYAAAVPVVGELDLEEAADRSGGMTGADIEAAVMVALGLSLVDGVDALAQPYLTEALLRQHHVEERPKPTVDQLRRTAVHEAGHTLWATLYWGSAAVASVSIREAFDSTGRTSLSDELEDDNRSSRADMWGKVAMGFAGLVAEELVYGHDEVNAGGGATDIGRATMVVRRLLGDLAGSPELGPVSVDTIEGGVDSDRGSERMRAELWELASAECRRIKGVVETAMVSNLSSVEAIADRLVDAPDQTLSGPVLSDLLLSLDLAPVSTSLVLQSPVSPPHGDMVQR